MFYPLDFTFVCPSEIINFANAAAEFRKFNCEILIGSCDSQFSHYSWCLQDRKEGGIGICDVDLFADKNCKMAKDFGVLLPEAGIALRGLFIIDGKGIVRSVQINDLPVGRSVDECRRLVKAFQYCDKTGEQIPCDWKEEKPTATIKADLKGMKEYFKKTY